MINQENLSAFNAVSTINFNTVPPFYDEFKNINRVTRFLIWKGKNDIILVPFDLGIIINRKATNDKWIMFVFVKKTKIIPGWAIIRSPLHV